MASTPDRDASSPQLRRTRLVCISDTHNHTPALPKGDVLIHAGDLTNQGTYSELRRQVEWLEKADFEKKIVIPGNHDLTLDPTSYARYSHIHNQTPQDLSLNESLFTSSTSLTYLRHELAHIILTSPDGPQTHFTLFGSPCSALWKDPFSAFAYNDSEAAGVWEAIPPTVDVLVTHTPAKGLVDGPRLGCDKLRGTVEKVRPRLMICGHIHEGRGCENVFWDEQIGMKNSTVIRRWLDPGAGTDKMSLVDLTGKRRRQCATVDEARGTTPLSTHAEPAIEGSEIASQSSLKKTGCSTCVVNAAIMARSYSRGPRQLNKPIVVDIELPIWNGDQPQEGKE